MSKGKHRTGVALTGRWLWPGLLAAGLLHAAAAQRGTAQSVAMLNDSMRLRIVANISALGLVSTTRPFAPGDPFFLLPESPFEFNTNTFDLHARQTSLGFIFTGPRLKSFSTGATFLALIQNDNLVADAYGFLPLLAYGELRNQRWRLAAGLNFDVFNPLNPNVLPIALLYGSGNTGTYRGQFRVEHYNDPSENTHFALQLAIGEPVASIVTNNRFLLEDNGWPNLELRIGLGSGAVKERAGGRKLRALELGVSGVIGQLRTTGVITAPGQIEDPDREVVNVAGFGVDAQFVLSNRFGLLGELYVGNGLGEYSGGVLQAFNTFTFDVIAGRGAFVEAYVYPDDRVHVHAGFAVDNPSDDDLSLLQIRRNQTAYATLFWDLNKVFQFSFEADYRWTSYFDPLDSADGMIFMSQVLFRF